MVGVLVTVQGVVRSGRNVILPLLLLSARDIYSKAAVNTEVSVVLVAIVRFQRGLR